MTLLRATFFVAGIPIPKARPRVVRRKNAPFPMTYTPKTTRDWEKLIANEYTRQCKGVFFEKSIPLRFYAEIVCPGTGSLSSVRGDIDNYCKAIFDALNELAFTDDSQVINLHVLKRRAKKDEQCGAYIEIEPAAEVQSRLFEKLSVETAAPWEKTA